MSEEDEVSAKEFYSTPKSEKQKLERRRTMMKKEITERVKELIKIDARLKELKGKK